MTETVRPTPPRRFRSRATARYFAATGNRARGPTSGVSNPGEGPFRIGRLPAPVSGSACGLPTFPDLLHERPVVTLEHRSISRALEFAFACGDAAGAAMDALRHAALSESTFLPAAFEHSLFLEQFISKCLRFSVLGRSAPVDTVHLLRLLSRPPAGSENTAFRQAIHAELEAHPALLRALEQTYNELITLIELFEESGRQGRFDIPRFRLDLLRALRRTVESMSSAYGDARSGLHRLHDFSANAREQRGFADLCALLDFEGDMARVDLHVCLGVDGRIRRLEVRHVDDAGQPPFYQPPLLRALRRLALWLRGYRLGEADLVDRWFDHVYAGVAALLPCLLQLRGDLEFYLAAQHFRRLAGSLDLATCLPEVVATADYGPPKRITRLFNPLLLDHERPPVPCDLQVDSYNRMCIVTGPNSGGKTRLLQAIGITQLLAQAGFYVPAATARLREASGLFVSLGEETTADQQEGRLGTELLRIRRLFECARPGSLVILDELCSGTNPSEGEEIFHLVMKLLRHLRPEVFITTHFLKFAAGLAEQADDLGLSFLQVELDAQERPTFQFVPGVARSSLARLTAERLGVTHEQLLSLVRENAARTG